MLEKNELPIVIPTVTAYHRVSFAMSVLIANHRDHFCMNNYINGFMHPDYIKGNDNNFLNFAEQSNRKWVDIWENISCRICW